MLPVVAGLLPIYLITQYAGLLDNIYTPINLPGIAATSPICFIFSWNELLFARVRTATVAQTAAVFLTGFFTSQGLFLAKVCRRHSSSRFRCSAPLRGTGQAGAGVVTGAVK